MPKKLDKNRESNSENEPSKNEEQSEMPQQLAQEEIVALMGAFISGLGGEVINPANVIHLNGKLLSKAWKDIALILQRHYEEIGDFDLAGLSYTRAYPRIAQLISDIVEGAEHLQKTGLSINDFTQRYIPERKDSR